MFNKFIILLTLSVVFISSMALAHGEDKPGPHQGHIRMPGAFHTELVSAGLDEIKIYLLDISFKNPVTKQSKVNLRLKQGISETEAECTVSQDFFSCKFPKEYKLDRGTLEVKASRLGSSGTTVRYELPLKFTKSKH